MGWLVSLETWLARHEASMAAVRSRFCGVVSSLNWGNMGSALSIPSSRNELHLVRKCGYCSGLLTTKLVSFVEILSHNEFSLIKTQLRSSLHNLRCLKERMSYSLGVIVRVLFNLPRSIVPSTGTRELRVIVEFSRWIINSVQWYTLSHCCTLCWCNQVKGLQWNYML